MSNRSLMVPELAAAVLVQNERLHPNPKNWLSASQNVLNAVRDAFEKASPPFSVDEPCSEFPDHLGFDVFAATGNVDDIEKVASVVIKNPKQQTLKVSVSPGHPPNWWIVECGTYDAANKRFGSGVSTAADLVIAQLTNIIQDWMKSREPNQH